MTAAANQTEAAAWNAERGEVWVRQQEVLDAFMADVLDLTLRAANPQPGEQVLDIGCGAGATTLAAARRAGGDGAALGLDISAPLVAHARKRAAQEGVPNASFDLADAQTHDFPPGQFDLLISRFGVMFFDNPVAAFRNMAVALKPGGRVAFAAWSGPEGNPWFTIPARAATARLGPVAAVDPDAPGPMAFRDIDRVTGILSAAGFTGCTGTRIEVFLAPPGSLDEVAELSTNLGPASRIIAEKNGTEADRIAIVRECRAGLAPYLKDGGLRVPATVNIFEARKPG